MNKKVITGLLLTLGLMVIATINFDSNSLRANVSQGVEALNSSSATEIAKQKVSSKLTEELLVQKNSLNSSEDEQIEVMIKYSTFPGKSQKDKVIKNYKGKVNKAYNNFSILSASIPVGEIESLISDSEVEFVDLDFYAETQLNDSRELIGAGLVEQNFGYTGEGTKVAILDTGIDLDHPALVNSIVDVIDVTYENNPDDVFGHGTHVACIVSCDDPVYKGIAPESDLYIAKIFRSNGLAYFSDIVDGLDWAVDNEVDIINMSLGARIAGCGNDILSDVASQVVDLGVTVVASAGNYGSVTNAISAPACAENVIAVASGEPQRGIDYYSSRGPTASGLTKPDITAPGFLIRAAYVGGGYRDLLGTSMASPHIAGVAALMKEANSNLTPNEIKIAMMDTALDLGFPETSQGAGFVQAEDAVESVKISSPREEAKAFSSCIRSTVPGTVSEIKECLEDFLEDKKGKKK